MLSFDHRKKGFTIVEFLVVIGIIALLLAILLPAVQMARESARRASCMNNLRQLGIAMHSYHDTHRIFPPGNTNSFSAFVSMLPHLDQAALYSRFEFTDPEVPPNVALMSHQLEVLQCPSDPGSSAQTGSTSYVANNGAGLHVNGMVLGVFSLLVTDSVNGGGPISSKMITDGLSNTAAFSELLVGDGSKKPNRTVWQAPSVAEPQKADFFVDACQTLDTATRRCGKWDRGRGWTDGNYPSTLYNHTSPPNHRTCTNNGDVFMGTYPAASLHPGGVLVCFADGTTRFVSESIDVTTWRAIGTRASGEIIGEF